MKKTTAILLALVMLMTAAVFTCPASAEGEKLTICGALGNDMVLQRDKEVNIWGTSTEKGATVTVTFKGNTVTATVDESGSWLAKLPAMSADTTENTLTAALGDATVTLTGILVGDVYFVGGQSNAEKTLGGCGSVYSKEFIQSTIDEANDMIRLFQQGKSDITGSAKTKALMNSPQTEPVSGHKWKKETLANAKAFSAIGFFFGHKMYKETGVPIGLVMVASSGSPLSQLMSANAVAKTGYTKFENDIPVSGMYNALMNPFIKMSIKGMIFYQGESEMGLAVSDYGKYNVYLNAYVEDLREKMGQDFPFFYVQMSSHAGDGIKSWPNQAPQRAVQCDGVKVLKNAGMVVSMDMGYIPGQTDWAHPDRKQPIGERLAALALCRLYGIGDEEYVTSPMPEYAYKTDAGIVVHFTHVAGGLKKLGSFATLTGFKQIKLDGTMEDVEAEIINSNEVLLKVTNASILSGVGYGLEVCAFTEYEGNDAYIANLGNGSDLPAPTFKLTELLDAAPTPEAEAVTTEESVTADGVQTQKTGSNTVVVVTCIVGVAAVAAIIVIATVILKKSNKNKEEE